MAVPFPGAGSFKLGRVAVLTGDVMGAPVGWAGRAVRPLVEDVLRTAPVLAFFTVLPVLVAPSVTEYVFEVRLERSAPEPDNVCPMLAPIFPPFTSPLTMVLEFIDGPSTPRPLLIGP